MKGYIYYIEGHKESEKQAQESYTSFKKYKWDVELRPGVTRFTVKQNEEFKRNIIEGSRLHNFKQENTNKYLTKISCAINHIQFWKEVVEKKEPMCFLEHDSICTMKAENYQFQDYLLLNAESVFRPPSKLGQQKYKDYNWPGFGINDFPNIYPLQYNKNNLWKNSMMAPGTGAYIISPKGAQKMLNAINKNGFDQSDFMINSYNIRMQYILPSPVTFNSVNLSTSYGL